MKQEYLEYFDGADSLEAYIAYPDNLDNKKPTVLLAPDWSGRGQLSIEKANDLAKLGYIGFALDMYGKGIIAKTKEEKIKLMQPFMQDRKLLKRRILAAFSAAEMLQYADPKKIGAIGFCFGGLCVLDLARAGADLTGVVSFHGLLTPPEHAPANKIKAKILILHGYDDPMVKPSAVLDFADEMTKAEVDWEIDIYGHTKHAFANPQANDQQLGTVYHPQSALRAWNAMQNFFKEVF